MSMSVWPAVPLVVSMETRHLAVPMSPVLNSTGSLSIVMSCVVNTRCSAVGGVGVRLNFCGLMSMRHIGGGVAQQTLFEPHDGGTLNVEPPGKRLVTSCAPFCER